MSASVCINGGSGLPRVRIASSSMLFTSIASDVVRSFHAGTMPLRQSTIEERYTFPAGIINSVTSVSHF